MALIIGVVGFKSAGKDTIGDYLVKHHFFERDSFANPLKDAVAAVFGWPRDMLEGATAESRKWREEPDLWWEEALDWKDHPGSRLSEHFTPRIALQLFGTEVFRQHFHNDIWILSLQNRLLNKERVVVTDCRFPNEFQAIKNAGGKVIRVKRGPEPVWYNDALILNATHQFACVELTEHQERLASYNIHASETAWIGLPFDVIIENDSTLTALEDKVECLITQL